MSGFSAEWLALREPADHAARAGSQLVSWLLPALPTDRPLRILDLACGTGSNLRCLVSRFGRAQHWTLVDHDAALLAALPGALQSWQRKDAAHALFSHEYLQLDLAAQIDSLDFEVFDLVTTAALLDLVSESWLERLIGRCRDSRVAVLFALNFDGRMQFDPGHAGDGETCELFNRHQRGNKGFGPALGPDAAARAVELLDEAGYAVKRAESDWILSGKDQALQAQLIEGIAAAAREVDLQAKDRIDSWRAQRLACNEQGRSRLRVGHRDIAARWPA